MKFVDESDSQSRPSRSGFGASIVTSRCGRLPRTVPAGSDIPALMSASIITAGPFRPTLRRGRTRVKPHPTLNHARPAEARRIAHVPPKSVQPSLAFTMMLQKRKYAERCMNYFWTFTLSEATSSHRDKQCRQQLIEPHFREGGGELSRYGVLDCM